MNDKLCAVPMTIGRANEWVATLHRHHKPTQGGLFAVGVALGERVVGVAIVGRPVARMSDDGWTAEILRVATDGTRNACSFLYARCREACRSLGYRKVTTYTLAEEGGASLRAAGFHCEGTRGGGSWNRPNRSRIDKHPTGPKTLWSAL